MKKLLFAVPVFIGLLTLLIYQGCSKTEEDPRSSDSKNVVIFEDLSILDSSSPSPLENHIYRIEILGNNEEMEQVVWEAEKAGFDLSALNIYGIKKYYSNNSDVLLYTVPDENLEKYVVLHRYDDLFQVSYAEYTATPEGITQFRMKSPDDRLYYGMSINQRDEIGEFIHAENEQIQQFSQKVYDRMSHDYFTDDPSLKAAETCCRQMADWEDCFECTMDYFSSKWYGIVAFATLGKEFTIAISVSCIGAGPTARC